MMNARLNKALVALLTVVAVGACDDPPVEPGNTDAARLTTNPSFVVIEAGSTREVQATLVNDLNNPVQGDISFSACNALITVGADEDQNELEPGTIFEITGVTLGESCVVVEGASFEDTIGVRVVPAAVEAVAATDTLRAGATGSIDVQVVTSTGAAVGPFAETDATFESSNEDALFFTDDAGTFDTHESDNVTVTVTFELFGVERTLEIPVVVLPAPPVEGELDDDEFATIVVGDTTSLEAFLHDSIGNVNDLASDIDSVVATSENEAIATAYVEITQDTDFDDRVDINVFAVGEGGGQVDINLTGYTNNGVIDMGSAQVTVLAPLNVVSVLPADQNPGESVVIAGTLLEQPGAETAVFVDGFDVTHYVTAVTPTAITLTFPGAGTARDYEIMVDVGDGATSDTATYTAGAEAGEPNDAFSLSAPQVTLPVEINGWFGYTDDFDFYRFTAPATGDATITLDWSNDDLDLDAAIYGVSEGDYVCLGAASAAHPETDDECPLVSGGIYIIYLSDYSLDADGIGDPTDFTATVEMN